MISGSSLTKLKPQAVAKTGLEVLFWIIKEPEITSGKFDEDVKVSWRLRFSKIISWQ